MRHKTNRHSEYYAKNREVLVKNQAEYYKKNRDKILERAKAHREKKRRQIDAIALSYGCKNKECSWKGDFHPAQLEFHHFEPKTKRFQIGKAADYSYKAIASEVNKCVVLCALLHVGLASVDESMLCMVNDRLEIIDQTNSTISNQPKIVRDQ